MAPDARMSRGLAKWRGPTVVTPRRSQHALTTAISSRVLFPARRRAMRRCSGDGRLGAAASAEQFAEMISRYASEGLPCEAALRGVRRPDNPICAAGKLELTPLASPSYAPGMERRATARTGIEGRR